MSGFLTQVAKKFRNIKEIKKNYEEKRNRTHKHHPRGVGEDETEVIEIDISVKTVVKVLLIIAFFLAAQQIFLQLQSILIIAMITFFLAVGLSPVVYSIEEYKIPRPLAILILYIIFFGALGVLFVKVIPILAEQLLDIAYDLRTFLLTNGSDLPILKSFFHKIGAEFDPQEVQNWLSQNLAVISRNLQSAAGSAFGVMSEIFKGVFNLIFAMVLLFFILLEREKIAHFFLALFPAHEREYIKDKSHIVQKKVGEWFKAQVIVMISVGVFMYFGMKILEFSLGMQYAATIGLLAGFMELFPYLGVLATGILAGLVALNISWVVFIAVVIWIVITQFLEGNILVPMVMEKVVGLSSVVTLLALAIGGVLGHAIGGVALAILGMILSIPVTASIAIFVEEYVHKRQYKQ